MTSSAVELAKNPPSVIVAAMTVINRFVVANLSGLRAGQRGTFKMHRSIWFIVHVIESFDANHDMLVLYSFQHVLPALAPACVTHTITHTCLYAVTHTLT